MRSKEGRPNINQVLFDFDLGLLKLVTCPGGKMKQPQAVVSKFSLETLNVPLSWKILFCFMQPRLALTSPSYCLSLLRGGIIGVGHLAEKVIHFLIPQITLKQLVHLSPAELICDQFISQRMFIMKGLAQKVNPHIFMQMLYFKSFFIPQRPTNIAMNQNDAL